MVGWLVFGALGAALAAELYVIYKKEEKISVDEQENECACKYNCCGCCKEKEEEEIEVVDSLECKKEDVDIEE